MGRGRNGFACSRRSHQPPAVGEKKKHREIASMTRKQWLLSSVVALTTFVSTVVVAGPIENYSPVTSARLENPEPGNWLMTRGNYKGWSYSTLDQINTSNVKSLVPVWSFSTGVDSGHEAPPIVNNGIMFVATPYSQVLALDPTLGNLLWHCERQLPAGFRAWQHTSV